MADEAVLRIVLDDSEGGGASTTSTTPPTPATPPTPPKTPPAPIDPSAFGHNYTATAKNLLRPIQFLDDRKKEREFLDKLLSHPELQSGGLQSELKRLGEENLAMYSSLRRALGRPDAPDIHTTAAALPAVVPLAKQSQPEIAAPPKPEPVLVEVTELPKPEPPPAAPLDPGLGRRPDEPRPAELDDLSEYSPRTRSRMERERAEAAGRRPDEPRPAELDDPSQFSPRTRARMERERLVADGVAAPPPAPPPYLPPTPPPYQPPAPSGQDQDAAGQHTYTGLPDSMLYQKRKREGEGGLPPPPPPIEPVKSGFDALLDAAESLRGTLGGVFGKVVGVALDLTTKIKDARDKAALANIATGGTTASSGAMAGVVTAAPYVAAVLIGDQIVKGMYKSLIGGVGGIAMGISSPNDDPSKAIEAVGGAMTSLGDKLPIVGIPLVVVGEGLKVVGGLMENFTRMAEKYGEYNPMIAQAQAMTDIRRIMGDMRRAQESGPELARFIKAQGEFQQKLEDVKMKVWMQILPVLTMILEAVQGLLGIADENRFKNFKDPTELILDTVEVDRVRAGATIPLGAPRDVIGG